MHVIVVSGDGDALAIGGNHFIHACRRNIDITLVVFNNGIYGMTGGQYSPTTVDGDITSTSPHGNVEPHFDVTELATGAGATFVARGTSYHVPQLDNYIHKGLTHKGFSVIDVAEGCYTTHGRKNKKKFGSNLDMLKFQKNNAVPKEKADNMTEEELQGKIITGIFCDREKTEFTEKYQKMIDSLTGGDK